MIAVSITLSRRAASGIRVATLLHVAAPVWARKKRVRAAGIGKGACCCRCWLATLSADAHAHNEAARLLAWFHVC